MEKKGNCPKFIYKSNTVTVKISVGTHIVPCKNTCKQCLKRATST